MPTPDNGPTVVIFTAHASDPWQTSLSEEVNDRGGHLLLARASQPPELKRTACVTHLTADAAQPDQVRSVFDHLEREGRHPDLVIFDGGRTPVRPFLDWTPEQARQSWQIEGLAGFVVGQEAMTRLLKRKRGTMLFVGRSEQNNLSGPFSMGQANKAGARALAQSMARAFGPQNIHVAHISLASEPLAHSINAGRALAQACWHLHGQHRTAWTQELDLQTNGASSL